MSFRKVGGVQYSATQNIVKNRYNTSDNLYVTQNVGEPNTIINFLSDISGNQIYGDLVVSGDVTANEIYLTGSIVDVPNSVVPKSYVDSIGSGIHPTFACQMATASDSSPIPSLSGYLTIDGVLTQDGYRVLVNNQGYNGTSNIANISNGIYNVSSGPWSRANDCNGNNVQGQSTFIQFGDANAKSTFVQTATGASPAIAGTDPLLYQKFSTINLLLGQGLEFVSSNTIQVKSDLSNNPFITQLAVSGQINALNIGRGGGDISSNTTCGTYSLRFNTNGDTNSAFGFASLADNESGDSNTACGSDSLRFNTSGSHNTAIGQQALYNNKTSNYNTAIGSSALFNNELTDLTVGNTAIGYGAMYSNVTGLYSTAVGFQASYYHTASSNTSVGFYALRGSPGSSGANNTAIGDSALTVNTIGGNNVAIGYHALDSNTASSNNTAIGYLAGATISTGAGSNTLVGYKAGTEITTGVGNICIGYKAGELIKGGSYNISIGNDESVENDDTFKIVIGDSNQTMHIQGGLTLISAQLTTTTNTSTLVYPLRQFYTVDTTGGIVYIYLKFPSESSGCFCTFRRKNSTDNAIYIYGHPYSSSGNYIVPYDSVSPDERVGMGSGSGNPICYTCTVFCDGSLWYVTNWVISLY